MDLLGWLALRILGKTFDAAADPAQKLLTYLLPKQDLEKLRLQINDFFKEEVAIYCFNQHEPSIHIQGRYSLTEKQMALATVHKIKIAQMHRPNDPHAILVNDPIWKADPVNLDVSTLDFSEVCALREEGIKPQILSAGAILLCKEREELILHHRKDVTTYPHALHIIGGAYIPDGTGGCDPDRAGLFSTMSRECFEETQINIPIRDIQAMVMAKELSTGFIQLVALGISVHPDEIDRVKGNWEGTIERVPFKDLPALLQDPNWVPSGKAHVLAWLGLGAPNTKRGQKFGGLPAKSLFRTIIGMA